MINERFGGYHEPWGSFLTGQPENNGRDDLRHSSPVDAFLSDPFPPQSSKGLRGAIQTYI
jgi:hypothetical protein